MEMVSKKLSETAGFAADFLKQLAEVSRNGATVVALGGDLGSGKTTFTQFLAKELGVTNYVTSPTFVIEKRYETKNSTYKTLIHIDCYRLTKPEEMEHLGWKEIVADPSNLIIVEWPERIEAILPENSVKIDFEFVDENSRSIKLK